MMETIGRGVLDAPPSRGMTVFIAITRNVRRKRFKQLRRPRNRLAPARTARLYRVGSLPVCRRHRPDIGRRLRRAEQVALHFRPAELAQAFALLLGFDAS